MMLWENTLPGVQSSDYQNKTEAVKQDHRERFIKMKHLRNGGDQVTSCIIYPLPQILKIIMSQNAPNKASPDKTHGVLQVLMRYLKKNCIQNSYLHNNNV